jgi:NADH-quinone oxidoreductase subunit H
MTNPLVNFISWLESLLLNFGLAPGFVNFLLTLLGVLALISFLLVLDIALVWVERKVVARFQDRLGPNRLGPFGIIQPIADVLKLLIKENITPVTADKFLFTIAPLLVIGAVLLIWAVIPLAPNIMGADVSVSVLYVVAVGSIGTLGIIIAGWASNNKYSVLGAFRTVAQMIAYEVPMVIVLMIPVLITGSMGLQDIVNQQGVWFIVIAPIAAIILLISGIAEIGRTPFDLLEAESEIVAGFHIEYTGMKFGLFYAGELLHALTIGALFSTMFLGGWRGPGAEQYPFLGVIYLFLKAFIIYYVIMWIKYTLPRVRIDHMLNFNWKFLTPLALIVLIVTAFTVKFVQSATFGVQIAALLGINIIMAWMILIGFRKYAHIKRERFEEDRPIAQA